MTRDRDGYSHWGTPRGEAPSAALGPDLETTIRKGLGLHTHRRGSQSLAQRPPRACSRLSSRSPSRPPRLGARVRTELETQGGMKEAGRRSGRT